MEERIKYLLKIICEGYNGNLGKKVTQKLFYFFEKEGIDLGLRYGIHFFGPYSARLNDSIYYLEEEGYISIDDYGQTHTIRWIGEGGVDESILTVDEENIANRVISEFGSKSPLELEGLATIDFIASKEPDRSEDEIIKDFLDIKGKKFCEADAKNYYSVLKNYKLIK